MRVTHKLIHKREMIFFTLGAYRMDFDIQRTVHRDILL